MSLVAYKKYGVIFSIKDPNIPVFWVKVSTNLVVFNFFCRFLLIDTAAGFSGASVLDYPIRTGVQDFTSLITSNDVKTERSLVVSSPCAFISVHRGLPFFDVPVCYALKDFTGASGEMTVTVSDSLEALVMPQGFVQVKSYLMKGAKLKLIDCSSSYNRASASFYLGTTIPNPPYKTKQYIPGSVISDQEVLVFQRGRSGSSYSTVLIKQDLPSLGYVLPIVVYDLRDEKSLFRDPRLFAIWGNCCTSETVELVDAYLESTIKELLSLFAKGYRGRGSDFLFFNVNSAMQQQLSLSVLCFNFELLVLAGFLCSEDVSYLQTRLLEVGINLKPVAISGPSVDLRKEIAFVEKSLSDFLQKLVDRLPPEERSSSTVNNDRARCTNLIAVRICHSVWFSWQRYTQGPLCFCLFWFYPFFLVFVPVMFITMLFLGIIMGSIPMGNIGFLFGYLPGFLFLLTLRLALGFICLFFLRGIT